LKCLPAFEQCHHAFSLKSCSKSPFAKKIFYRRTAV
jgi:hypothetical protein